MGLDGYNSVDILILVLVSIALIAMAWGAYKNPTVLWPESAVWGLGVGFLVLFTTGWMGFWWAALGASIAMLGFQWLVRRWRRQKADRP